jgi:heme A synthase
MALRKYSLFLLVYSIFAITFGAVVRATGSGAGCGSNWPFCQDEVNLTASQMETVIDFTHRLSSGLTIIFVLILLVWVFKIYEKKSKIRSAARFVFFFVIVQTLIGAGLILFNPVGENSSIIKALIITLHLVNSFFLLASNAILYEWVKDGEPKKLLVTKNAKQLFTLMAILFLVLGASGTITALGDTIFSDNLLTQGVKQNFSGENFLLQLRVYHPIIAVMIGLGIYFIYNNFLKKSKNEKLNRYSKCLAGLFLSQLFFGVLTLILNSPIWMQLIHLFLAEIIWIIFILWINQIVFFGLISSLPEKP